MRRKNCPVNLALLFLLAMTMICCSKDEDDEEPPTNTISAGTFQGKTSKNQDVYLHVNAQSLIDSMTLKIKVNYVTYTCTYLFCCSSDFQVRKSAEFESSLMNSSIFICSSSSYPTIKGTFTDADNCSGIITTFKECGGFCGSYMTISSGSTIAEQNWSVQRVK